MVEELFEMIDECQTKEALIEFGYNAMTAPILLEYRMQAWERFVEKMQKLEPGDSKKTICVVDLSALFHAGFERVDDTIVWIERKISGWSKEYSHVILAIDSDISWRIGRYPEYKSSRRSKTAEFIAGYNQCIESMQGVCIVAECVGYEADDVMGSVAFMAKLRRQACVAVTSDRDFWQCLGAGVCMYSYKHKEFRNKDWLVRVEGLTPKQSVDYLSLVGKDDVPSAKGIGEKKAKALLAEYGSVDGIMDRLDELPARESVAVKEFYETNYWLARELHTLRNNLHVMW